MNTTKNISEGSRSPRRTAGSATYVRCYLQEVAMKPSEDGDPQCETDWKDPESGDSFRDRHDIDGRMERDLGTWARSYGNYPQVTLTVLEDLVGKSADLVVHATVCGTWIEWILPPGTVLPK